VGGSPSRGSFKPGVNQYYNNWDFNVLGTIYNLECRSDVFWDFKKYIADPIGMQDYRIIDGTYEFEETSLHPGYPFKMSTRDLAKFGQLYLQQGNWNGKQIFDTSWIKQSLTPFQVVENTGNAATGYGYLWWIQERIGEHKRYFALGWGEQYLGIFPDNDIVIVLRADSYSGEYFIEEHRERLINLLLNANMSEPNSNPKLELLKLNENKPKRILLTNDILSKYIGNYRFEQSNLSEINADFTIKMYENGELIIENLHYAYKFELIPLSLDRFYIEDIGLYLKFEQDQIDNELRPIITKE
jgi:CubicO group peptidase (beta-lactamase class C family)